MNNQKEHNLEARKALIYSLDLTQTMNRLIKVEKWKEHHAIVAGDQYKNFLYLKLKFRDQFNLPPSYEIDEVWHAHILHTKSYMNFCNEVFGDYLHHSPHHGEDGDMSDEMISNDFQQTQKLYFEEFGTYIYKIIPTNRFVSCIKNSYIKLKKLVNTPRKLQSEISHEQN